MSPDYISHLEGGAAAEYLDDVDGRRRNERTKEVTALPPSVESAHRMKFVRPSVRLS